MAEQKFLYCASTTGHLENFHLPYIRQLHQAGYHIVACADAKRDLPCVDEFVQIPFAKQIASPENIKNIIRIYRLLKQQQFTAISVHTTLAAAVVRAAVLLLPPAQRPEVYYTCHGYLFDEQDGLKKWKYLLPEKICAGVTDVLLVMNQTDKQIAQKHRLYRDKLMMIPGMGVDFSRFDLPQSKETLRQQYGIASDEVLFVFAGEFSSRKNQQMLISAFARAARQMPKARLILAGSGVLQDACQNQVQRLQLQDKIIFPGQVKNMPVLYGCCDVCVSASRIEGLPFNIMEAMYCQLPCIASHIKGHADLLQHGQTGYLYETEPELAAYMVQLYRDPALRENFGWRAKQAVMPYGLDVVQPAIMQVYEESV